MIELVATHLLRGHVARCANNDASRGLHRRGASFRGYHDELLSKPEIEDLYMAIFRDEEVLRLEISMDDAHIMCGGKSLGYLNGVFCGSARRHGTGTKFLP